MANNRELSQLGSIVDINDSNQSLGIGSSVGIGTTSPDYQLDVRGDINFNRIFIRTEYFLIHNLELVLDLLM